ncbi:MAG: cupin domain-containing protein [Terriglobia bacterium]
MNSGGRVRFIQITLLAVFVGTGLGQARAAAPAKPAARSHSAVYFSHQQVAAGFAKGGYLYPLGSGNFSVMTARRDKAGEVELHTRDTDVIYIVDGSATFVTGGKMEQPRHTAPDELRGSSIEGGEVRHISKGDTLIIPAGVPHWFKEVPGPVLYLVVKVR